MRPPRVSLALLSSVTVLTWGAGLGVAETVAPGVAYTVHNLPGPVRAHVVAVDRSRSEYDLKVGWPQGQRNFTARAATSAIAGLYDSPPACDVVAAVNGSFFESASSVLHGAVASDGEILEAPDGRSETFLFGPARLPVIREAIAAVNGTVTFANGTTAVLHQYNRPSADNRITAYTPTWAPTTGTSVEGVEVILADVSYPMRGNKEISGIVTAVKTGAASINNTIPEGGMVLSARGTARGAILANTAVGDRIRVRFATTAEEFNNADMAITGTGWILRGGTPNTGNWAQYASPYVDNRRPRTILGWNNTHLFFVVIDGRSPASVGMTFAEAAAFLGGTLLATDAVNLDGDGSSTLVVDGRVRNKPCDGAERPVANAVLLVREAPAPALPFFDPFSEMGRRPGWDDKFRYNDVRRLWPAAPGGDGYALVVGDPTGGVETVRRGSFADADYAVEADIYCEYRPDVAANGFERYGIFARDSGTGAFTLADFGGGNSYAMTYDSDTGRIRAGVIVNGTLTDFRESDKLFADWTAWHRFRIACKGTTIAYSLDGDEIARVTDTKHARGYFGIAYQDLFRSNGNIRGTRVDSFAAVRLGPPPGHTPYLGTPSALPGIVQAEDYDGGGEGIAHHSTRASDATDSPRSDNVDIRTCDDRGGGYAVAFAEAGEWLEYSVNVAEAGRYDIRLRVASAEAGETFRIEMNGRDVTGLQEFEPTGGPQTWRTVTVTGVELDAGDWQVLRLVAESGGWSLNSIEIVEAVPPPAKASDPTPETNATDVAAGTSLTLRWIAGAGAASHNVYFGEGRLGPEAFRANQAGTTFDSGPLARGTTYFWRVDEVNDSGVTRGDVWQFTTEGIRTAPVAADFDGDGDVDRSDFHHLQRCFNGPDQPPDGEGCEDADLDDDGDVDGDDFNRFQACFNGANRPPACD